MGIYYDGKLKQICCNNQNKTFKLAVLENLQKNLLATKPVTYCAQNPMETLESIYFNATFFIGVTEQDNFSS